MGVRRALLQSAFAILVVGQRQARATLATVPDRPLAPSLSGSAAVNVNSANPLSGLGAGDGYVAIPSGTFELAAPLRIRQSTRLEGMGYTSCIRPTGDFPAILIETDQPVCLSQFRIEGFRDRWRTADGHGVFAPAGAGDLTVRDLFIRDVSGAGIILLGGAPAGIRRVRIDGNTVERCGAHAILCQQNCWQTIISGNFVADFGLLYPDRPGITTGRGGQSHIITSNIVRGSPAALGKSVHGISIDNAAGATIVGNVISDVIGYGIEVGWASNVVVSGNTISDAVRAGVGVSAINGHPSTQIIISGNSIIGSTRGIYAFVHEPRDTKNGPFLLTGNVINTVKYGVHVSSARVVQMAGNIITDTEFSGIIAESVDSLTIEGNTITGTNRRLDPAHAAVWLIDTDAQDVDIRQNNAFLDNGLNHLVVGSHSKPPTTPSRPLSRGRDDDSCLKASRC